MRLKIKALIIWLFISSVNIWAQDGSPSPYSFFGLGDASFDGGAINIGMGQTSVYTDSLHYFLNNPASLAELKYVNLKLGIKNTFIDQEDVNNKIWTSAHNINYFALGFPIGKKFGAGFGILPETSTKYNIYTPTDDGVYSFQGSGGLSKIFIAGAYKINKNFSAGIEYQYHFGFLQHDYIWVPNNSSIYTRDNNYEDFSGGTFKLSLNYHKNLKKNKYFQAVVNHRLQTNLSTNFYGSIRLIRIVTNGEYPVSEDLKPEQTAQTLLPSSTSLGVGYGEKNKWFVNSEFTYQNLSDFKNPFYDPAYVQYKDAFATRLGGFYKPEYNSITSYWKRVTYRAGAYFKNTGLNIYGEDIRDFGITFGLGLPGLKSISNLNLGMEIGRRGIKTGNLVLENYFNLHISLSLNDRWFVKRKIN